MDRSRPLFLMPPTGMEDQIAFAPSTVPRGWVLLFYCLAASSSALQAPQYATLKPKLRWNTWMALDDGGLFLETSEVNIQALFALAIHGDSFATPNMSWTLVSHACRMAQALNLHLPGEDKRRLLLFWSLYAVDKGASLAFGRPPTLPFPYYQTVPFPDINGLADYTPHFERQDQNPQDSQVGGFGAIHFIQTVVLSMLTGKILHFLNCIDSFDLVTYRRERDTFHEELSEWYSASMKVSRDR
jgi:hypothetical protein